jgi:hypothetical protein
MTANITVTAQAANGELVYWVRASYQVIPQGKDKFLFQPTAIKLFYPVDEKIEALTQELAVSPLPPPPENAENHLELEEIIWKIESVNGEGRTSFTPDGAKKVKEYVLQNREKFFPRRHTYASHGRSSLN